ncbi:DUF2853 family protein [Luteococcus peritonei]|uniref:DUF2853 family protein n=1 Tax=Luteococcus peritonei TaxID=88874 RepID=A0ABW4RY36_9ACTN
MDHLADIQKYAPGASAELVTKMEQTYRLVLSKADSAQVSFSDPEELARVRENFVQKKLGITDSDAEVDEVIASIGAKISGRKNRLTVYYLLAEHYGRLDKLA